ncbi:hypothetical protein GW17_00031832 [Ensete ventricosum]|nr:hypothetical protein GW17_00031832 [Ensete ventricosum]
MYGAQIRRPWQPPRGSSEETIEFEECRWARGPRCSVSASSWRVNITGCYVSASLSVSYIWSRFILLLFLLVRGFLTDINIRVGDPLCSCLRHPPFLPPSLPPSPLSLSSPRSKKAELGEAGRLLLGLKFGSCSTSCGLRLWIWEEIRGLWVACFCVDPPDSEDMKSKMRSRMGERAATFSPIKESPPAEKAAEWEFRPGGMLVQKRDPDADAVAAPVPAIRVKVKYGAVYHEIYISSQATFGKNSNRSFLFLLLAVAVGPAKVVDELTE